MTAQSIGAQRSEQGRYPCSRFMPGKPVPYDRLPKHLRRKAKMSLSKVTGKDDGAAPSRVSGDAVGIDPSRVTMHSGGNRTHHQLWPAPAPRTIWRAS